MDFKTISWRSRWGLLQTPKEVSNSHILILKQEDLNHPLSAGGTAQQGTSKPGGVWSAVVVTSWHRQWRSKQRQVLCWMSYWQTRSNWSGIWRPRAALAAVTRTLWNSESWGRNKTSKQTSRTVILNFKRRDFGLVRVLLGRVPQDMVPERSLRAGWFSGITYFQAQEQSGWRARGQVKQEGSRRPISMNRESLTKLKR